MIPLFIKFSPDNYTDNKRTPWAGTRIAGTIKAELGLNLPEHIGESWEFSASEELPSKCTGAFTGTLKQLLDDDQRAGIWLSQAHRKTWGKKTPLLLKFIDADYDLSLQLHPPIETPSLCSEESGKWEAWIVLRHEPGAGIYLGLRPGVTREQLLGAIKSGEDIKPLLHFIPVHNCDVFTIPPKMLHALGAGVCVLEPQIIQPGKRPVSLRLHDWNRRYDEFGNLCPNGRPRALHVKEVLHFFDFNGPRGDLLLKKCLTHPYTARNEDTLFIAEINPAPCLRTRILSGTGTHTQHEMKELTSILAIRGDSEVRIGNDRYLLRQGESGIIAASAEKVSFVCRESRIALNDCIPERYDETKEMHI